MVAKSSDIWILLMPPKTGQEGLQRRQTMQETHLLCTGEYNAILTTVDRATEDIGAHVTSNYARFVRRVSGFENFGKFWELDTVHGFIV